MKIERVSRHDTPRHDLPRPDSTWLRLMGHFCRGLWGEHKENMQNAHKSHWLDGRSAAGNHRDVERDDESWRNRSASRRKQFQVRAWEQQSWQGRPCVCRINDFLFVKSKRNSQRIHVSVCVWVTECVWLCVSLTCWHFFEPPSLTLHTNGFVCALFQRHQSSI